MTPPLLTLHAVNADLLFYDDQLAVVPRTETLTMTVVRALRAAIRPPRRLPWGTTYLRYADVRVARLERRAVTGAWLILDDLRYDVRPREMDRPWTDLLSPFFGDRLTVT